MELNPEQFARIAPHLPRQRGNLSHENLNVQAYALQRLRCRRRPQRRHLHPASARAPQLLLANAQYDWLMSEAGAAHGWERLTSAENAQQRANGGWLVVAAYRNHRDNKPGHIAIVRPSTKSARELRAEGPQVTQAGMTNYRSTSLRNGFADHPAAWSRHEVLYFAHAVDPSAVAEKASARDRNPGAANDGAE